MSENPTLVLLSEELCVLTTLPPHIRRITPLHAPTLHRRRGFPPFLNESRRKEEVGSICANERAANAGRRHTFRLLCQSMKFACNLLAFQLPISFHVPLRLHNAIPKILGVRVPDFVGQSFEGFYGFSRRRKNGANP